ncbi:hypothetical protein A2866_06540 [Candidatus Roizmanbacteria bacterium RIFCSPHIGHO2_01_FULL_39_8]|uniref:Uncharacterized protein n=2 Tax=Candidatus Roizmaniibacteriota TaxID=1752723 RepID=A0A1F7GGZ1_9BACT|nr:MAG: hypothetical protein A2866_06540 [Candidatus Roizmanbacteria bacterium RIFCSPHIGHO2_01_FULL_39_8]OGK26793.1 MAG: hypothetical protein A3C28_05360 [Candidatus Roizmanbacteria bacterium RIFCSPHIGHO2_02_FULL_39_9]
MSSEGKKITRLYPTNGEKPFSPHELNYNARVMALRGLYDYHLAGFSHPHILTSSSDPFLAILPFLRTLEPDPHIDEYSLARFFAGRKPAKEDLPFIYTAQGLMDAIKIHDIDQHLATCTYRTVSAVSRGLINIGSEKYVVGAAGYSGGHEFLSMPPNIQKQLMAESLCEALIVGGFSLVSHPEEELFDAIRQEADHLIETRDNVQPFSKSPNCVDFSRLAITGAKNIAQKYGTHMDFSQGFAACFMHKHNPKYSEAYQGAGLPLPAQFGRLRCISSCAETQAMLRTEYAVNLPVLLGADQAYLIDIKRGETVVPNFPNKQTSEYIYLTDSQGSIQLRRAIIDRDLTWNPHEQKRKNSLLWIYPQLLKRGIDPDQFAELSFIVKEDAVVVSSMGKRKKLTTARIEATKFQPLAIIPLSEITEIPIPRLSGHELQTNAPPCIYCTHQIHQRKIEHLHIDRIDWEKIKADDALSLEYFMKQFKGRVTVS